LEYYLEQKEVKILICEEETCRFTLSENSQFHQVSGILLLA